MLCLLGATSASAGTLYARQIGGNWSAATTWSTTGCLGIDSSGPPALTDDVLIEDCAGPIVLDVGSLAAQTVFISPLASVTAASGGEGVTLSFGLNGTGTVWSADPGCTIDIGTATLNISNTTGAAVVTFAGGGHTYGRLGVSVQSVYTVAITGANTIAVLSLTSPGVFTGTQTISLPAGTTTTLGNLTTTQPVIGHYAIVSDTPGSPTLLSKANGTINVDFLTVIDVTATGGATWCAYRSGADGGGNMGWSFVACPIQPQLNLLGVGR